MDFDLWGQASVFVDFGTAERSRVAEGQDRGNRRDHAGGQRGDAIETEEPSGKPKMHLNLDYLVEPDMCNTPNRVASTSTAL